MQAGGKAVVFLLSTCDSAAGKNVEQPLKIKYPGLQNIRASDARPLFHTIAETVFSCNLVQSQVLITTQSLNYSIKHMTNSLQSVMLPAHQVSDLMFCEHINHGLFRISSCFVLLYITDHFLIFLQDVLQIFTFLTACLFWKSEMLS